VLGLEGPAAQLADAISGGSPEQKQALASALQVHEEKMAALVLEQSKVDAEDRKAADTVETAMLASSSAFTRNARPLAMYGATVGTLSLVGVVGYCLVSHTTIDWSGIGAMVALLAPLWGHSAVYTLARSREKIAGQG
jgi:hypothetical protein